MTNGWFTGVSVRGFISRPNEPRMNKKRQQNGVQNVVTVLIGH